LHIHHVLVNKNDCNDDGYDDDDEFYTCHQWRRYTRARRVKSPGWKIHRPGSALPIALLCFGNSVNKNYREIPYPTADHFICFILTVKQSQRRWRPFCFEGDD